MGEALPQLGLVGALVVLNALFAGSEMALVSLREGQLQRLEALGGSGEVLARLARDPNRFLATIQIGITLAGFLASASAAVALAQPVEEHLGFLGGADEAVSIVLVTLVLSYVTLVFGELAPKRVAMQRAERWGLLAARPLAALSRATRPAVWLLSRSADVAVRLMGADPSRQRDVITDEEIRDMVAAQSSFTPRQRAIIEGAFEVAERSLHEVLRPRRDVFTLDASESSEAAISRLVESGFSRAPVVANGDLDATVGVVHLRALVGGQGTAGDRAVAPLFLPETVLVLDALHVMQQARCQLAMVLNEHGSAEGIVTVEDLVEELVGEIYDESDRDVIAVIHGHDGSLILPGGFPFHDLDDLGVELPEGDYATVAGLVLSRLGRIPDSPGDVVGIDGWTATVLAVERRAITKVRLQRTKVELAMPGEDLDVRGPDPTA